MLQWNRGPGGARNAVLRLCITEGLDAAEELEALAAAHERTSPVSSSLAPSPAPASGGADEDSDVMLGPCRYLVPFPGTDFEGGASGRPAGVAGLGDQANDLAIECGPDGYLRVKPTLASSSPAAPSGDDAAYAVASAACNLLAFRFTLELQGGGKEGAPPRLVPGMPLLVATFDCAVDSARPMEVGHAYGFRHWAGQLSDQRRWGN